MALIAAAVLACGAALVFGLEAIQLSKVPFRVTEYTRVSGTDYYTFYGYSWYDLRKSKPLTGMAFKDNGGEYRVVAWPASSQYCVVDSILIVYVAQDNQLRAGLYATAAGNTPVLLFYDLRLGMGWSCDGQGVEVRMSPTAERYRIPLEELRRKVKRQ